MHKLKLFVLIIVLTTLTAGCSLHVPLHSVDIGMSKKQVLNELGTPLSAHGDNGNEYLWFKGVKDPWNNHYVHFVNGKVYAYGTVGTFARKDVLRP